MFESTTTTDIPARTNRSTGASRARAIVQHS
ncbi:hypothetical protein C8D78_3380 [Arthrobacter oryzae]|uniref:Uncharacterized protein n=1 Tax=Arthrobacter oryzae TaxID=409290 RepID=A0A495E9X6_9MICC|nr:hypothetical protein C8D78_3380 [Arthrobacter oryzae]